MAVCRASDVAKWFLAYNKGITADQDTENITNLKLQKLLYYAFGTYYAMKGEKLFDDPIVAWQHGPVVVSVYHEYKSNGSNGIVFNEDYDLKQFGEDVYNILVQVYEYFGKFTAWSLRNMTHNEKPWKETRDNDVISPELIRDFFLEEYVDA